jgi:hypothetical protein
MADRRVRLRWHLHESTARGLAQLAFVLLGVVPMLLCLAASAIQFWPGYQRMRVGRWEDWLSSQLGVEVSVSAFEARAPERFALHGIHLRHPETQASIGRVRLVEAQWSGSQWAVRLTQPELEGRQLATAWRIVHDWFLCRPQRYAAAARIGMSELTVHDPVSGDNRLSDVTLQMIPTAAAVLVKIGFELDDPEAAQLAATDDNQAKHAQLIIKRHHGREMLRTEMQLRTGVHPLPCSLVTGVFPAVDRLGQDARFAGVFELDISGAAWQARVHNGSFSQVDFGKWTQGSGVSVSGQGEVFFLEQAILNRQRLEYARGGAMVRHGQVSPRLFFALGKHLGVSLRDTNPVSSYGFDQLSFAFEIGHSKLQLAGAMEDVHGGLAVRDQSKWNEPLSLECVVAALADCCSPASTPNELEMVSSSWLSKQAIVWLPLGEQQLQTALRAMRLSQTR